MIVKTELYILHFYRALADDKTTTSSILRKGYNMLDEYLHLKSN